MAEDQHPQRALFPGVAPEIQKINLPTWFVGQPNVPLSIYEGALSFQRNGREIATGQGKVEYCWTPSPGVQFTSWCSSVAFGGVTDFFKPLDLCLTGTGTIVRVQPHHIESGAATHLSGRVLQWPSVAQDTEIDALECAIPNFCKHACNEWVYIVETGCMYSGGRLFVTAEPWNFTLDRLLHDDAISTLQKSAGYAVTHRLRICRSDGSAFAAEEGLTLANLVSRFFTFCRGAWCAPLFLEGSRNQVPVARLWGAHGTPMTNWRDVPNWMPAAFPPKFDGWDAALQGFLHKCQDLEWRNAILDTIHWYTESNLGAGGLDGAIVLGQAALELLAWTTLITCAAKPLSKTKAQNLSAAGRIREMCSEYGIPHELPKHRTDLCKLAAINKWSQESAFLIAKIRNTIVHPRRDGIRGMNESLLLGVHQLTLWYIEMVLLRLFGYNGVYSYRLHAGALRIVPWAERSTFGTRKESKAKAKGATGNDSASIKN